MRAWEVRNPKQPAAEPTISRVWFPSCEECGRTFCSRTSRRAICGDECYGERKRRLYRDRYAADPAAELERHKQRRSNAPLEVRLKARARNQTRRAALHDADAEQFSPLEIYERDRWVCGLCELPIDPSLRFPDPGSPSIDHKIPLSRGGLHTRVNTRATHLGCNCSRGNRDSLNRARQGRTSRQGRSSTWPEEDQPPRTRLVGQGTRRRIPSR